MKVIGGAKAKLRQSVAIIDREDITFCGTAAHRFRLIGDPFAGQLVERCQVCGLTRRIRLLWGKRERGRRWR